MINSLAHRFLAFQKFWCFAVWAAPQWDFPQGCCKNMLRTIKSLLWYYWNNFHVVMIWNAASQQNKRHINTHGCLLQMVQPPHLWGKQNLATIIRGCCDQCVMKSTNKRGRKKETNVIWWIHSINCHTNTCRMNIHVTLHKVEFASDIFTLLS